MVETLATTVVLFSNENVIVLKSFELVLLAACAVLTRVRTDCHKAYRSASVRVTNSR